uniref:Uncharacterized protein n=1 Tax=Halalkalibacterium halodurans TaxID=86665 RepID=A0A0M0KLD8_ALKHA
MEVTWITIQGKGDVNWASPFCIRDLNKRLPGGILLKREGKMFLLITLYRACHKGEKNLLEFTIKRRLLTLKIKCRKSASIFYRWFFLCFYFCMIYNSGKTVIRTYILNIGTKGWFTFK